MDNPIETFPQAEEFLLGLVNYEQLPPPMAQDTEGWHLEAFREFLGKLGNPQNDLKIIHVAGTKGKGSTTRLISSLLSALGWKRVGSFTSPHIENFRERICIDNEPISESHFVRSLQAVRAILPAKTGEGFRTTFEVLTAMALWHFREQQCEAVVLETGLGGRLDSTNAATARVALITPIGFEHQRVLGPTIRSIATEKTGIITPGTGHAIVGPQAPRRQTTVFAIAREQARRAGVPLSTYDSRNDPIRTADPNPSGFSIDLRIDETEISDIHFHVLGQHQINNLRAALMAVRAFNKLENHPISPDAIRLGIENFRSPGRLEIIRSTPPLLVDFAHCPLSTRAAMQACTEHFPGRKVILVLGLMRDKKPQPILKAMATAGIISHLFTHTPSSPRARSGDNLAEIARLFLPNVVSCRNLSKALEQACAEQRKDPEKVILVTGTAYSIAEARRWAAQNL